MASERLDAGESRLDKIIELISQSQTSIHDLSKSSAKSDGEAFRMNMPFELGLDLGFRRFPDKRFSDKRYLVFEEKRYDLKRALSDLSGVDVEYHENSFERVIQATKNFPVNELGCTMPGKSRLEGEYYDFQAWLLETKRKEGLAAAEVLDLQMVERTRAMQDWVALGKPPPN
ncbi:MAG: hypothetical protein AAGI03_16645 [Pseudomonadota bacterium]